MRRVYLESPFAGRGSVDQSFLTSKKRDGELNLRYAKALCRALFRRGDAAFASHLYATQFLDDTVPEERARGIEGCLTWGVCAQATVVGIDRGFTPGMLQGLERARAEGRPVEWVSLPDWLDSWLPSGVDRESWCDHVRPEDRRSPELSARRLRRTLPILTP